MAAAAAGINKQVTVAVMEPCIRHGRGANAHTVKVDTLPISLRPTISTVVLAFFGVFFPGNRELLCLRILGLIAAALALVPLHASYSRLDCGLAASESCARKCLLRIYIVMNVNRFGQIDGRVLLQC